MVYFCMMRPIIQLFGQLLAPTARRFHQALDDPESTQTSVQREICDRLIATPYGKALGINSIADWERVPIVDYDTLAPWFGKPEKHHQGQSISLTPEPILFYEKTSGSSGAVKWIPYTQSLRRSFNQMFCVWAHDLIANGPKFSTGKLYACISPQLNQSNSPSLQDDLDYLDGWLRWFLRPWLVMPNELNRLHKPQQFKHQLALALLQAETLEIISIWSPSFLQVHLKYIQENHELLRGELQGRISRDRLQLLGDNIPWTQLWPSLKLISCWDSANAADQAKGLRSQFPNVLIQGKGLLATEAPMTIPLIAAQGYVPVLDEVFFEFEDDIGSLYKLHELSIGQEYTIILSQKGGLYRYRIGDRIRVTHWYRNTPCLEFLGRHPAISDLVGEKLQETFVHNALNSLNLPGSHFKSLVPVADPPQYILLLDAAQETPEIIAQQLDQALSQSHHYERARSLGQLAPPKVFISQHTPEILALYRAHNGSVWGGIKHQILATSPISTELLQKLQM